MCIRDSVNPDHVIATISGKVNLNIMLHIARGRGYQPSDSRESDEESKKIGQLQPNQHHLLKLPLKYCNYYHFFFDGLTLVY